LPDIENIVTNVYNIIMDTLNKKSDNIRLFVGTYINLELLFSSNNSNLLKEYFNTSQIQLHTSPPAHRGCACVLPSWEFAINGVSVRAHRPDLQPQLTFAFQESGLKNLIFSKNQNFSAPSSIKWIEKENIHFTWKFIGDVEQEKFDLIANALQETVNSADDIALNFKKITIWPNNRFPRQLVIIGDDVNGNATKLYKDINLKLVNYGIKKEKRSFNPHITLARFRLKNKPTEPINLPNWLEFDEVKIDLPQINLIKSDLTPKGSIYTVLKSYNL